MADPRDHDEPPVQIDLYGIRVRASPKPGDYESPKTWKEVWRLIHDQIKGITVDTVGLISDILRGSRNLVRGIGALPPAIAARIESAHQVADRAEEQRRAIDSPTAAHDSLRDLFALIQKKRTQGFAVQLSLRDEGFAICFLPPADDQDQAAVLDEAMNQLLETQSGVATPRSLDAASIAELETVLRKIGIDPQSAGLSPSIDASNVTEAKSRRKKRRRKRPQRK